MKYKYILIYKSHFRGQRLYLNKVDIDKWKYRIYRKTIRGDKISLGLL